jgi:hypothetical protein
MRNFHHKNMEKNSLYLNGNFSCFEKVCLFYLTVELEPEQEPETETLKSEQRQIFTRSRIKLMLLLNLTYFVY